MPWRKNKITRQTADRADAARIFARTGAALTGPTLRILKSRPQKCILTLSHDIGLL